MQLQQYISVSQPKTKRVLKKSSDFVGDLISTFDSKVTSAKNKVATFDPKVENAVSVFDHKVPTFPTFGPKIKPRRQPSIYKWLRDRTSGIDIGVEIEDDGKRHPIHLNTNVRVLEHFERLRNGEPSFISRISNMNYLDHLTNVATFYFAGAAERKKGETLVLLDIDCKKVGSLEGALAFAEFLRQNHFPNLYYEPSTHGRGAHGYFVLDKWDMGAEYINKLLLRRLQPWLRQILKEHDFDVEDVEVKGTCPEVVWGQAKLEVTNYKSGTLGKLPRLGSAGKEEALRNTTRLSVDDLARLPVVERTKGPTVERTLVISEAVGSTSGKVISEGEIDKIDGHYGTVSAALLKSHELRTSGKTVVTTEDLAIFLLLIRFFTNNMNLDGSLPVKRWKNIWQALFEAGDVGRAFCPQRFKVIRDHLSSLGLLDWQDSSYCLGWYDRDGKYHKGKACKWKASHSLLEMLEVAGEQEGYQDVEGEAPFMRTQILSDIQSIDQLPLEQTIRPVRIEMDSHLRVNPDDIGPLITPFEAFIGVAA